MRTAAHSLLAINAEVMRKGPVLTRQQGITLCKSLIEDEIHSALKSIDDDKTPGVDGFNALFYKRHDLILERK